MTRWLAILLCVQLEDEDARSGLRSVAIVEAHGRGHEAIVLDRGTGGLEAHARVEEVLKHDGDAVVPNKRCLESW